MSRKAALQVAGNVLREIRASRQTLSTYPLRVHQTALSYISTQGTKPAGVDDGAAQYRRTPAATETSSRSSDSDSTFLDNGSTNSVSATQQPPHVQEAAGSPANSKPIDNLPDYSIANEHRWQRFTRAEGANGNMCSGRSILLTGGTSGIGLAVAQRAVLEGASHVIIVTRAAANGSNAVQKVVEKTGLQDAPVSYLAHDFLKSPLENVKSILNPLVSQHCSASEGTSSQPASVNESQ